MPSNHLILCYRLLLLSLIFPSIRVFFSESVLHIRWPNDWSFSFSISPSNAYSGLISFRMDWLDLLAVQGTFKSLLQHHSSKASILWCSAFFIVSHPYMTTGKTIALTRQNFVDKVMSLLFNMLSRLVIAFLPRSKRLFISWLGQRDHLLRLSESLIQVSVRTPGATARGHMACPALACTWAGRVWPRNLPPPSGRFPPCCPALPRPSQSLPALRAPWDGQALGCRHLAQPGLGSLDPASQRADSAYSPRATNPSGNAMVPEPGPLASHAPWSALLAPPSHTPSPGLSFPSAGGSENLDLPLAPMGIPRAAWVLDLAPRW